MTEELRDELRELQRRAYGPRPDIHLDTAAIERLRELERTVRNPQDPGATPDVVPRPVEAAAASGEESIEPETSTVHETPAPASPPASGQPAHPRRSLRRGATWAVALTCAFVLGACAAALFSVLLPGARPVATLTETPEFTWPEYLGAPPAQSRGFTEYLGMTVLATGPRWNGVGSDDCLIVLPTTEAGMAAPMTRSVQVSCGTDDFPATVQFNVTRDLPDELVERHPTGSALQFVLTASGVDVLAR